MGRSRFPARVLTGPVSQAAADALELLADAELAAIQVDVLPAEPEDFTAAHPVKQQQDERGVERVGPGGAQEGHRLVG